MTPGTPIDLTGASAQFFVRSLTKPTIPQLTISSPEPTANGSNLALGGTAGTLQLTIASADTDTLQTGAYDLRIRFPNGTTQTYLTGAFTVTGEVEPWSAVQS